MITFLKQNKLLAVVSLLFVLGIVYYAIFMRGSTPALLTSSDQAPSPESQQLLVTLTNLKAIKLDDSVFSDPVFLSLTDFGVIISPEPIGRGDPFLPADAASSTN